MELLDCFEFLTSQIHSVVVATVDAEGHPVTRVVDLLGCDDQGLYFTTSAGKNFHRELLARPHVALSGMWGNMTTECVAVSVKGETREESPEKADALFDAYPYMRDLYPTPESMATVRVFCIHRGSLEWYDLRKKPMERLAFTFGGLEVNQAARKHSLAGRIIELLAAELGLVGEDGGAFPIPDDPGERAALVEELVARRGTESLSCDFIEVLQLYRG